MATQREQKDKDNEFAFFKEFAKGNYIYEKNNQKENTIEFPIDGLHTAFERYEKDGMHADCGDWSVNRDISAQPCWWELTFAEEPVARCVPSEDFGPHGQYGDIDRLNDKISDKNFSDICDVISSVSNYYRMAPQERERINANQQTQGR